MKGWITLHRKLLKNPIACRSDYLAVWVHLLLMANHEETSFIWNNKKQILKKGQLLTGRKRLSKQTGVTESQVYKILEYLELEQQIEQQKTTRYTVITIVNWGAYQKKEQQSDNRIMGKNNKISKIAQNGTTSNALERLIGRGNERGTVYKSNNRVTTTQQQSNTYNNVNNNVNKQEEIFLKKKEKERKQREYEKTLQLIKKKE